jgi:hypothetical protein
MTLLQPTEPTAAQDQLNDYNSSVMVKRASYSPSAGMHYAMIGLVLADAAVPGDEATLVADIVALAGITSVGNPRFWGQIPSTLHVNPGGEDPDTHEAVLYSTANLGCVTGTTNNNFSLSDRRHGTVKPPLDKKWMVINVVLPGGFADQAAVDVLETALEGVTGVTTAKVLLFGQVPDAAVSVSLSVETRVRIDPVPEE